ncbi:MAG: hypothetical protein ABJ215_03360 [Alphaproteobacteria bacterium]
MTHPDQHQNHATNNPDEDALDSLKEPPPNDPVWQVLTNRINTSNQAAVDIGLVSIRSAILINGGAIVALLAFVGQLWTNQQSEIPGVLPVTAWFVFGLISGCVAAGFAYFFQTLTTQVYQHAFDVLRGNGTQRPLKRFQPVCAIGMVLGTTGSYGLFIYGALLAMGRLA